MKKFPRPRPLIRFLALLAVATLALPLILSLLVNLRLTSPTPQPTVIDSPYHSTGQYVIHSDSGHAFSLSPYYFYNDEEVFPFSEDAPLKYRAGPVWYAFSQEEVTSLDSALDAHPEITFFSHGTWKEVLRKDNDIYLHLAEKAWPFDQKAKVCTLPDEDSFFSPIRVDGAEELAMLVLSGKEPSQSSSIQVYCLTDKLWSPVSFCFPDQTETIEFLGWARRHIAEQHRDVPLLPVGLLELGQEREDGSMILYSVKYQDGQLVLDPLPDEAEMAPDLWQF